MREVTYRALSLVLVLLYPFVCIRGQTPIFQSVSEVGAKFTEYDKFGNLYTAGDFEVITDFDPGPPTKTLSPVGGPDIFITKTNPAGALIWAKSIGGSQSDAIFGFSLDKDGNIYLAGWFYGQCDFDPGVNTSLSTSNGSADVFLAKLDSAANFIWAKSIGGNYQDRGGRLQLDSLGNIYNIGTCSGLVDMDPGPGTFTLPISGSSYILKLDPSGNFIWAKRPVIGFRDFAITKSDQFYAIGSFKSTVDFDPGPGLMNLTSSGIEDVFLEKLNSNGDLIWVKSFGGTSRDFGRAISVDGSDNLYCYGQFSITADFDPSLNTFTLSGNNMFISKYDSSGSFIWAKAVPATLARMKTNNAGDVYTIGSFSGIVDFDLGPASYTMAGAAVSNCFAMKLNNAGNFVWAVCPTGPNCSMGESIGIDTIGNVVCSLNFYGSADFDWSADSFSFTVPSSISPTPSFLLKICEVTQPLNIVPSSNFLCRGESNTLTVTGGSNYLWNTGSYSPSIIISPSVSSIFDVKQTERPGCVNKAAYMQNVELCEELQEEASISQIKIFPNPFTDWFTLQSTVQIQQMKLYNTLGDVVLKSKHIETNIVDMTLMPKGVYIITVDFMDGAKINQKLVKH
jgi:hypothetical protein